MADKCISCNRTVTARQEAIQCDGCLKWNHRTCNTAEVGVELAATITAKVKAKASVDIFKPASAIVEEVLLEDLKDVPCLCLPKPEYLARVFNRHRQRLRPKDPRDLNFDLEQDHIPDGLLRGDLQGHDALEDVKALNKILFKSSLQLSLSKIVNKSGTIDINSAIGDMNYLDRSHALLKSLDEIIGDPSEGKVMKKSTAKKLADSGLGFHHLKSLFDTQGEQGLLAVLANPPTNSRRVRVRGTAQPLTLHIDGVIFTRDYFDFNVMVVVAMVCCEVFFTDELSLARCSFIRSCRNLISYPDLTLSLEM
ncbi:hypothetical protein P5673_032813 [Acropora cervicornis]|uniref:PML C-terminal domain-containing protein n=1 Tax=Acropora cervicornis TaxID=6130 RepID=A0AAD9PQR7_ACRCE|nr:hypothetical protein P5673_032813 [Acropora cervicornis]